MNVPNVREWGSLLWCLADPGAGAGQEYTRFPLAILFSLDVATVKVSSGRLPAILPIMHDTNGFAGKRQGRPSHFAVVTRKPLIYLSS